MQKSCEYCSFTCKYESYLVTHYTSEHSYIYNIDRNIEEKSKKFYCDFCSQNQGFNRKQAYFRHLKDNHVEEFNYFVEKYSECFNYICKTCDLYKFFEKEHHYTNHLNHNHPDKYRRYMDERELAKDYVCNWCEHPKGYDSELSFKTHVTQKHGSDTLQEYKEWKQSFKEYQCPECWRGFDKEHGLKTHISKTHYSRMITIECEVCGDERVIKPSKKDLISTCGDSTCQLKIHRRKNGGVNHPQYIDGQSYDLYYGPNWKETSKEIRERDNYKCQDCGMGQDENGSKLEVHHIVPLRLFADLHQDDYWTKANDGRNLITLCSGCHTARHNQSLFECHQDGSVEFRQDKMEA